MTAPYRINRRYERASAGPEVVVGAGAPEGTNEKTRAYLGRLISLIPGDIVSLYLGGANIIGATLPDATLGDRQMALGWAGFCFVALLLLRIWGTADRRNSVPPEWPSVFIAAVAFGIWLYNVGCPLDLIGLPFNPKLGMLLILGWTFLVPVFYSGDNYGSAEEQPEAGKGTHTDGGPKT
jgi:hypothetical protein